MPRTWKEDSLFRERIRAGKVQWDPLLTRKNNRHPKYKRDRYYIAQGGFTAKGYILYWIYSTQKAEQDAETRKRHTDKALEALREIQSKLNRYSLKKRKDINLAVRKVLNHYQCQEWIDYKIHSNRQYRTRHRKPGRPKANQAGKRIWSQYFSMTFDVNNDALEQQTLTDGVFPLITNVKPEQHKPKKILEIYKFQPFLEKRHSQLKTWQEVTPVLLKKGERLVAFLHVHIMALITASLIERQLRCAMKKHSIDHLPIYPETRHCPYPTMTDIVRLFREVERYEVEEKGKVTVFPAKLNRLQKQVLKLLEVPLSLYQ